MTILQQWSSHVLFGDSRPVPMSRYWRVSPLADVAPLVSLEIPEKQNCLTFLDGNHALDFSRHWKIATKMGTKKLLQCHHYPPENWPSLRMEVKSPGRFQSDEFPPQVVLINSLKGRQFWQFGWFSVNQVSSLFSAVHHSASLLERSYSFRCLPLWMGNFSDRHVLLMLTNHRNPH